MTKIGLTGKYKISKFKAGEEEKEVTEFHNLITDWGLRYQALNDIPVNICVGTSATEPSVGDSDLKGFLYSESSGKNLTTSNSYHQDLSESEWYVYSIFTATFAPKNTNYIIREIGFGRKAGDGIYSRAITKDLDGNPTDIVVLADEYLRVSYELRMYFKNEKTIINFTPTGDDKTPRTAEIVAYKATGIAQAYRQILTSSYSYYYKDAKELGDASNAGTATQISGVTENISQDSAGFGGTIKLSATVAQGNADNVNFFKFGGGNGSSATNPAWKVFLPVGFKKTNEDVAEFALHVSWGRK